jgi:uncharacterized protein with PQ loop repeat
MSSWDVFSYIGLAFAVAYRIPQIVKVCRNKRADDLSACSYLTHNAAYVSFIVYLVGSEKLQTESVLCFYYIMGITQNLVIIALKWHYTRSTTTPGEGVAAPATVTEA